MSAPVKNTCPNIDRAIRHLKIAISEARGLIEDKKDFQSIEYEIESAIDYLEDLRSSNDSLRKWGNDLEDQLQEAGEQINELENQIAALTDKEKGE